MKSKLTDVVRVSDSPAIGWDLQKRIVLMSLKQKVLLQTYLNGLEIHFDNQ